MVLRKCPACKELVGAESIVCPRCGVSFRAAMTRKVLLWTVLLIALAWAVMHFAIKKDLRRLLHLTAAMATQPASQLTAIA